MRTWKGKCVKKSFGPIYNELENKHLNTVNKKHYEAEKEKKAQKLNCYALP